MLTKQEIKKIEEAKERLMRDVQNVAEGNPEVVVTEEGLVPGLLVGTNFHELVYTSFGYHLGKTPSAVVKCPDGWEYQH